jgi:polar amino acid transport system substrate-binding protein
MLTLFLLFPLISSLGWTATEQLVFSFHDFPPFSTLADGKPAGPFIEIIDAVCKEIHYDCSYQQMPNRRSKKTLREGIVNGNFPLGWNKGRDGWLWFTIPLMKTEYGFFGRDDNEFRYSKLEDIQGLKVGVFGPSNTSNSLEKIRNEMKERGLKPIQIEMHPNADGRGLKKVSAGRFPLYYVNKDFGRHHLTELGISNVRYLGTHKELFYFAGFAKKHNQKRIIDEFNRATIKLADRGVLAEILNRYGISPAKWDEGTLKMYRIEISLQ